MQGWEERQSGHEAAMGAKHKDAEQLNLLLQEEKDVCSERQVRSSERKNKVLRSQVTI